MTLPVRVTFRHVMPSDPLEEEIRDQAIALERFHHRILDCRILVDAPHRHRRKGKHFRVRVELAIPGEEIVVNAAPHANEDPYAAVREAFDVVRRKLERHHAA